MQVVDVTGAVHNNQLGGYDFTPQTQQPTAQQLADLGYLAVQAQGYGRKGTQALMLALEQLSSKMTA